MSDPEPMLLSVRQAAQALGCGRDSCYGLIRSGRLRVVRIGRTLKVPRQELTAFLAREVEAS